MNNWSGNGISEVWRAKDGFVYKRQPKYLTDNEIYALEAPALRGFVPKARRLDVDLIQMEFIEAAPITDRERWINQYRHVMEALRLSGLRHGDLSVYSVIPRDHKPILIDWAESRVMMDPRPNKRRVADSKLLLQTMEEIAEKRLWTIHERS